MYKGEVRAVQNMVQIVVVIVHLWGGKLALVNNIFGRKGTNVKSFREGSKLDKTRAGRENGRVLTCCGLRICEGRTTDVRNGCRQRHLPGWCYHRRNESGVRQMVVE